MRDLEETVAAALVRATELAIPADACKLLERAAESLRSGPRTGADRANALAAVLAQLDALDDPEWTRAALARGTEALPGVGPRRAERLARRGLRSVGDLLFHLPSRYDDRTQLRKIGELEVGARATFVGEVLGADFVRRGPRRRFFEAVLSDDTGTVNLKWFRTPAGIEQTVRKGLRLLVSGDVRRYRFSKELNHPEVRPLREEGEESRHLGVVADYAQLDGIAPRTLRRTVELAVEHYADLTAGWLPAEVVRARELPGVAAALAEIHRPEPGVDLTALLNRTAPAYERLILEELYLLQLGLALRRAHRVLEPGIRLPIDRAAMEETASRLPFRLTGAQARAWQEIRADLERPNPMHRLLQGDVGSGKTAVAFLAACAVRGAGHQTALMAPTELLAEQHERTLRSLARAEGTLRVGMLTSSVPRNDAAALRAAAAAGDVDLLVGTHALVQEDVRFARLALAVVDEQHRFGVLQRAALAKKGAGGVAPHSLVMTATPIPRTLALTAYGDLDLSVIDELPPGRQPVATHLLRAGEGRRVLQLLRDTLARGEQAYVVYPLVEETERTDLRAATEQTERIRGALPGVAVDLVHGRMEAAERAEVMARFDAGTTRVLVSTTVVEVGVDVSGATLMIVEHAERFGLAQLHQLRGRVGRGDAPGTCLLVARGASEDSEARLRAMLETTDGFRIADRDLRIRGPGEFLGTRQHGRLPDLRVADLLRDAGLLGAAREAARNAVARDATLRTTPGLADAVQDRWGDRLALAGVG